MQCRACVWLAVFGLWALVVPTATWAQSADEIGSAQQPFPSEWADSPRLQAQAPTPVADAPNDRGLPLPTRAPRSASDDKRAVGGLASGFWTTVGSLSLVILLILGVARLWKRHGPATVGLPAEAVEVLGRRCIDQRQSILLVRLGGRILILGSATNGLVSLAEITDPTEVDNLSALCQRPDNAATGMMQSLGLLWQRRSSSRRADEHAAFAVSPAVATTALRSAPQNADSGQPLRPEAAHG